MLAGISTALSIGSVSADVVAVEARKAAQQRSIHAPPPEVPPLRQQVISLTERRLAELPGDDRRCPRSMPYDDLLARASS